jgi:hypothetical protein
MNAHVNNGKQNKAAKARTKAANQTSYKELEKHLAGACRSGDIREVKALLRRGVSANTRDPGRTHDPVIRYAVMGGHLAVVNELLCHAANPYFTDDEGWTLLHYAWGPYWQELRDEEPTLVERVGITTMLAQAGCHLNESTADGKTFMDLVEEQS